jgi:DNA primase small subunit
MSLEKNDMDIEEIINSELKEKKDEFVIPKGGMKIYYANFFPYEMYFSWLGRGEVDQFQRREFSFTLENDVYFRFQSYKSSDELKKKLIQYCPKKIDIGAMYNVLPTEHKTADPFFPQEKEIVFDIDMTDYDDIRTCCQEAKLCNKCWKYMIVAYKILDKILREDFGFEHILYAFSGRRGIHAWLCDERARILRDDGRIAIANYIKYKMSNVKMEISQGLHNPLHPAYVRAIKICDEYFEIVLDEQNLLNNEKGQNLLMGLLKAYFHKDFDEAKVIEIFNNNEIKKSSKKLSEIQDMIKSKNKKGDKKNQELIGDTLDLCINDFKLNILYPRLDINVSTHINHLLKSPFCIHPKTGLVAVPLSEEDILKFKMDNIPRLDQLINDYNNGKKNENFEKYLTFFKNFVDKLKDDKITKDPRN